MQSSKLRLRSIPGSAITGPALWSAAKVRVAQWDRIARSRKLVERAQMETLLNLTSQASETELGRAHGYGRTQPPAEFAARVPLRTYADYEPLLERMRKGARDVIWPGFIKYWGQSSGSSNTAKLNKFLPV